MLAGFQKEDLQEYAAGKRDGVRGGPGEDRRDPDRLGRAGTQGRRAARRRVRASRSSSRSARRRSSTRRRGIPIVYGRFDRGANLPTVTVYNHLDVQPAEGPDWKTPPFDFVKKGDRYFGRGTTDDKGPAMTALFGARYACEQASRSTSTSSGSSRRRSAARTSRRRSRRTRRSSPPTRSSSPTRSGSRARVRRSPAGLRGLQGFRFDLQTGETDQHSGTAGGAARNPVTELCQLIAECVDGRTGRVKIPGFYADVVPPTKKELEDLKNSGFTASDFKKDHLFRSLRVDDPLEIMKRIWMMPTFEVHGIAGGYQGARRQDDHPAQGDGDRLLPARAEHEPEEDRPARHRLREVEEPGREGLRGARAAGLPGQDDRPVRRRDPRAR